MSTKHIHKYTNVYSSFVYNTPKLETPRYPLTAAVQQEKRNELLKCAMAWINLTKHYTRSKIPDQIKKEKRKKKTV